MNRIRVLKRISTVAAYCGAPAVIESDSAVRPLSSGSHGLSVAIDAAKFGSHADVFDASITGMNAVNASTSREETIAPLAPAKTVVEPGQPSQRPTIFVDREPEGVPEPWTMLLIWCGVAAAMAIMTARSPRWKRVGAALLWVFSCVALSHAQVISNVYVSGLEPLSAIAGLGNSSGGAVELQVTVQDVLGNYVQNAIVTFSAPAAGAGVAAFSNSPVRTGPNGTASTFATVNSSYGSYRITATAGSSTTTFRVLNVNPNLASGPCVVTSALDDDGPGTLRSQVATCGRGGVITFAPGVGTVTLAGRDIPIISEIAVDGGSTARISGNGASRIFFVGSGTCGFGCTTTGNLSLRNITLTEGHSKGGDGGLGRGGGGGGGPGLGGAVYVQAGSLTAIDTTFFDNSVVGGVGSSGGGSYLTGQPTNGYAGGGGGARSAGDKSTFTVDLSRSPEFVPIDGNSGTGGDPDGGYGGAGNGQNGEPGGGGGGALNASRTAGLGGVFGGNGNHSEGGGGAGLGGAISVAGPSCGLGIECNSTRLILDGVTFAFNRADGGTGGNQGQGKGGALFLDSCIGAFGACNISATNYGSTFSNNTARDASANNPSCAVAMNNPKAADTNDVCGVLNDSPDLAIAIAHTGNFTPGLQGIFTITVRNTGAGATTTPVDVLDVLPAGLTYSAIGGSGWNCTSAQFILCSRPDALAPGASYPPLILTVKVAASAPPSVVNTVTVSGGGESPVPGAPSGLNSTASDTVVIQAIVVSISALYIDRDNPAASALIPLAAGNPVYAGSQHSTTDTLQLSAAIASPPNAAILAYTWSVTGPGSQHYSAPMPSTSPVWLVGDLFPQAGTLIFKVNVTFAGGGTAIGTRAIEVGIRTDDTIVVGWIDPTGITLPVIGVSRTIQALYTNPPTLGLAADGALGIGALSEGLTSVSVPLPNGQRITVGLTPADSKYILFWLFKFAANSDPLKALPGGDFWSSRTSSTNETTVANFVAVSTNYKLFNRFQVKYRVLPNVTDKFGQPVFNGAPVVLHQLTNVGTTQDPFTSVFPDAGQHGPADAKIVPTGISKISLINDGSPAALPIRAFNALSALGMGTGTFWENIGSRIVFAPASNTSPVVVSQPYPTYYVFQNGILVQTRPEAATPLGNFVPNPYPFGTVPCPASALVPGSRTVPGGRCGDGASPANPTARIPPYVGP
jgi:uncharacterized repeat protein (TIGR01451 family)